MHLIKLTFAGLIQQSEEFFMPDIQGPIWLRFSQHNTLIIHNNLRSLKVIKQYCEEEKIKGLFVGVDAKKALTVWTMDTKTEFG